MNDKQLSHTGVYLISIIVIASLVGVLMFHVAPKDNEKWLYMLLGALLGMLKAPDTAPPAP